jgi:Cu(I)/Ag(I) efflux system membrane fusion protein
MRGSSSPQAAEDARGVLDAARARLRLWGFDEEQIAALEARRAPSLRVTIRSPIGGIVTEKMVVAGQYVMEGTELYTVADLSQVWMTAYVPESGMGSVFEGQGVEIRSDALPGESFAGTVRFVWPVLDRETRTLRVRADVPNPGLRLRPGMYVDAILAGGRAPRGGQASPPVAAAVLYTCPMHPEVVSDKPGSCPICGMRLVKQELPAGGGVLAVPESAVIQTGTRSVVYLEREPGVFDAVEVELGTPTQGYIPVLSGLTAGERVVTRGAFLVDAEIRLNPAAAGSYFGSSRGPSSGSGSTSGDDGHRH